MRNNQCIDVGRQGCPCVLAQSGDCLGCSKLSGGSCDDCAWQGSCVYTVFEQNQRQLVRERKSRSFKIVEVKPYNDRFCVFVLRADRGFCQKAQTAGAYVFVEGDHQSVWYDMPISVLKAEPARELIHLGICACGPKSKNILKARRHLHLRGVYYNGLSGMSALKENPQGSVVFAKGIALAPLRNFLDGGSRYEKYLKNLCMFVDLDKVGLDFFTDYFGDIPAQRITMRNFAAEGLCSLDMLDYIEASEDINVFALSSPYYADQIERAAGRKVVRPTEGNMCCGEGVCGACTYVDEKGNTVRRCKVKK